MAICGKSGNKRMANAAMGDTIGGKCERKACVGRYILLMVGNRVHIGRGRARQDGER